MSNGFKLGTPYMLLLAVEENPNKNISQISRISNISYSQSYKSLMGLENKKLINLNIKDGGRSADITLTKKGKKVSVLVRKLIQEVDIR